MSQRYIVTLTKEHLDALRHAQSRVEREYEQLLRERLQGFSYWQQQPESFPEKQRYLSMAKENCEWACAKLEQIKGAATPLSEAKPCEGPGSERP